MQTEERTRPFPASAGSLAGPDAPSRTKYLAAELRFANVVRFLDTQIVTATP